MRRRVAITGLGCGLSAVLLGFLPVLGRDHLLLQSASLYFGVAYATAYSVMLLRRYTDRNSHLIGVVGFLFVFGGTLLLGFIPVYVWPGTSSGWGSYTSNGVPWAFVSALMYAAFSYGSSREFVSRITSTGMVLLSLYPLVDSLFKVVEEGSPQVASEHLMPLLLIYGLGILASVPLYISGQSVERKRCPDARNQSTVPVGIAVVCSIYVVSFLVGLSYYHPPLANLGSVSFLALLITPVLVVAHAIWKVSFGSPETHVRD